MISRTASDAAHGLLASVQAAVSCIGTAKITISPGGRAAGMNHAWTINEGQGLQIRGGEDGRSPLTLRMSMRYGIVRATSPTRWRVTTRGYLYAIDLEKREALSWHWHPDGNSAAGDPHLHPGSAVLLNTGVVTPRAHIPTQRMSVEEVIRFLVSELGVEPSDDKAVGRLAKGQRDFEESRTWSVSPDERNHPQS